jgi:hypothetical protein
MELFLQFGHGMMEHSRVLVDDWGGGTVILSPRDLNDSQLMRFGPEICGQPGGSVLLDPQFYLPHADHARLTKHAYWPDAFDTGTFWHGPGLRKLLSKLLELNQAVGSRALILPGVIAPKVDLHWLRHQVAVSGEAKRRGSSGLPLYATVALGADALRRDDDVHAILDVAHTLGVEGVYLVCEHPKGDYLVKDAGWMANLLDLVAGLRLKDLEVIVGYANHQTLAVTAASATAIASGTWMNVRSFPPEKFTNPEDDPKQRTTWFYSPRSLSEYNIPFLDVAQKVGLLNKLKPPAAWSRPEINALFSGRQPTAIDLTEPAAFRHYLTCLWHQTGEARLATFDETLKAQRETLDKVERLLAELHSKAVTGKLRDFRECVDVNRAALATLESNRGPILRRKWAELA